MRRRPLGAGLAIALVAGLAVAFLVQRSRPRLPEPPPRAEAAAEEPLPSAPLPTGETVPGDSSAASAGTSDLPDASDDAPASAAAPGAAEDASAEPASSELIPLEKLLSWEPRPLDDRIDLSAAEGDDPARSEPSVRLGVERGDDGLPLGSRRGTRTEIDLSVPVGDGEDFRLRGGVRVDGEEGGRGSEGRETLPTLGIEKRF